MERGAARRVLKLRKRTGRTPSRAGKLTNFKGDLKAHSAAEAKLVQRWQDNTLTSCVNAHADTEKNEYTEEVALGPKT